MDGLVVGMNRGLAVGFIIGVILMILYHGWNQRRTESILVLAPAARLFRRERFGHHYAEELYLQFVARRNQ